METLGERFQRETKYARGKRLPPSRTFSHPMPYKEYPDAERIPLSTPKRDNGPGIWKMIARRKSIREFVPASTTKETLSQLLWATQGIRERSHGFLFRTVPSAGALYPIETYLMANHVDGLKEGLYHFHVPTFSLEFIREGALSYSLAQAALDQYMMVEASVVFIWTAIIDRCRVKYGERAFRYIYLDAGHVGQNLYLAATSLELGCCTVGAFLDDEVNKILDVNGIEETVLYMGVVGSPITSSPCP